MNTSPVLYRATGLPVLQNIIYSSAEEARVALTGDISLVQSSSSGLVYNADFDENLLVYDQRYQNEQACSPIFQKHLDETLGLLFRYFRELRPGVEIGCGKGHFLEMALQGGLQITGYDPTYEGDSPHVVKSFYQAEDAQDTPGYFVLRHVLEHISDPWGFLQSLSKNLDTSCLIYIEVPGFEWIVENEAFYDIFYEHCNYFTLESLTAAFSEVVEAGYTFGGQYLYVVADLATFARPREFDGKCFAPLDFNDRIARLADGLDKGRENYLWGAGAKGVTMANLLLERGVPLEAIIDINPAKQGGVIGHSALPVVSPEEALARMAKANVLIMNPNYADEISKQLVGYDVKQVAVN